MCGPLQPMHHFVSCGRQRRRQGQRQGQGQRQRQRQTGHTYPIDATTLKQELFAGVVTRRAHKVSLPVSMRLQACSVVYHDLVEDCGGRSW